MAKVVFPLTQFMCNAMKATPDQLRRANYKKMAEHYGIQEQHCRDIINWEKMMKGVRDDE